MSSSPLIKTRETREGWPLLTLETEVKGYSKSTNDRVLPWLVHCACHDDRRDFCSALAVQVGTIRNIFFFTAHYFDTYDPIAAYPASWAVGRQPCWIACLLQYVSLFNTQHYGNTRCVRKQMRRAILLKNGSNQGDYVKIKYMENPFLHLKASES